MRIACLLLAALAAGCSSPSTTVDADRWGDRLAGGVTGPSAFWRKAVAPVFDHGFGYTSSPFELKLTPDPTTVEEGAGVAFVQDAFAKRGIALTERDVVVYHGPASHPDGARARRTKHRDTGGGPWVMDLVDPERRIAVEFISKHDVRYLDACEDTYTSGGWELGSCTLWLAARAVVRGLRQGDVDPYVYLVFYDPTDDDDFVQLDAQVRDAMAWLREQGVLHKDLDPTRDFGPTVDPTATGLHALSSHASDGPPTCRLGDRWVAVAPDPTLMRLIRVSETSGYRAGTVGVRIGFERDVDAHLRSLHDAGVPGIALVHKGQVLVTWSILDLLDPFGRGGPMTWCGDPTTVRAIVEALDRN